MGSRGNVGFLIGKVLSFCLRGKDKDYDREEIEKTQVGSSLG